MVQLTEAEAKRINRQNRSSYETGLGDRIRTLESGVATADPASAGKVPIYDDTGALAPQSVTGDVTIDTSGVTSIGADKVLEGMVKVKTISVTIAAGSATGTVTDADAVDGVILGVYPSADAGSAIKSVALTAGSGKIDVELLSNQAVETPATVQVVVLQAA